MEGRSPYESPGGGEIAEKSCGGAEISGQTVSREDSTPSRPARAQDAFLSAGGLTTEASDSKARNVTRQTSEQAITLNPAETTVLSLRQLFSDWA